MEARQQPLSKVPKLHRSEEQEKAIGMLLASKPASTSSKSSLQICPIHGDPMRLYCISDDEYLCGMCFFEGKHKDHEVKKIDQDIETQKLAVSKYTKKLAEEYEEFLCRLSAKVSLELSGLTDERKLTQNAILSSFREAHEKLEISERKMLDTLEARTLIYENDMMKLIGLIQTAKEEMHSLSLEISRENNSDSSKIPELAQKIHVLENTLMNIRLTKILSTKVSFKDDNVHFNEYVVSGPCVNTNVKNGPDPHSLTVSWTQITENYPGEYVLEYRECSEVDTSFAVCYTGKDCIYTIGGLEVETEYEFRISLVINGERIELCEPFKSKTSFFLYDSNGHIQNSDGDTVHFGRRNGTGHIYCGKEKDQCKCGSCDGRCGPTNGCPCDSCEQLIKEVFSLVKCPQGHNFTIKRGPFTCNSCNFRYQRGWFLKQYCSTCDYSLCLKCGHTKIPERVRSKIFPTP